MAQITPPVVFQTDSIEVKKQLQEPNYLIEYNANTSKEKYCIIYFSSNNIYFPNTKETFQKTIIDKNHYEWFGTRIKKGQKHIFIRDIQKQWYLHGINNKINSVEKLVYFLIKETEGYKVITLGSSSGGFASVLFGSFLNAEKVLSFNGQFQVLDLLKTSSEVIDPIVFREKNNLSINKYFSIKKFIKNPARIYYFFSNKSDWDITNKKHIEDVNALNIISFTTSNHGIPFVRSALPFVLNAAVSVLNSWRNKTFNPLLFSIKYGGLIATFKVLYKKFKS
ncbi:hypothetical protein [Lutibacter sp.]